VTPDSLAGKVALARAVAAVSRRAGRGGTSLPGKLLLRMDEHAVARLADRLTLGSVVLSATNGKTTTAAMLAGIAERAGVSLVRNRAGANMEGGVASSLLDAARQSPDSGAVLGLFEVDEFWLERLVAELHPRVALLGNLFRDQLDRYGELEAIADRWAALVHANAETQLVLNADDPLVADLGRERANVLYFGLQDPSIALAGLDHAVDAKHCRRCGSPYTFASVYLGHLGDYHCENCGQRRPIPAVTASQIELLGVRSARFMLSTPIGAAPVALPLPGLYNVYNAVAAAAGAVALELPLQAIVAGLGGAQPVFGRAESLELEGRELRILLVKNPVGANEVLRTLALEQGQHDLLGVLNDNTADGRDVSWIWDADFETIAARVRHVTCSGTRAAELGLRLKYAGVQTDRIEVVSDLAQALERALAQRTNNPDGGPPPPLYALPTYTAMLALRRLLAARGLVRSSWA
jgi:UDP-N-acetylmuramyl tripeptide synthase